MSQQEVRDQQAKDLPERDAASLIDVGGVNVDATVFAPIDADVNTNVDVDALVNAPIDADVAVGVNAPITVNDVADVAVGINAPIDANVGVYAPIDVDANVPVNVLGEQTNTVTNND
jgi:hypothetical protein